MVLQIDSVELIIDIRFEIKLVGLLLALINIGGSFGETV